MGPTDFIVIAVILLVIGLAAFYVIRAKKKGARCIGCPDGCNCSAKGTSCNCTCGRASLGNDPIDDTEK